MSNSEFKLNYSWEELRPIHPLYKTVMAAQAIGAACSYFLQNSEDWFLKIWIGAAFATFPGFLIGLILQHHLRPGSISENRSMIGFVGFLALLFFLVAFVLLNDSNVV